jgi:hypothetical protein
MPPAAAAGERNDSLEAVRTAEAERDGIDRGVDSVRRRCRGEADHFLAKRAKDLSETTESRKRKQLADHSAFAPEGQLREAAQRPFARSRASESS